MAFPATSNPVVQAKINGTWTDVTSSSRLQQTSSIQITRGAANEQTGTPTPQTCNFLWKDADGLLSNRNPLSAYFGLLPLGTPVRVLAGTGDNFLKIPYNDQTFITAPNTGANYIRTDDKATLDITGDIDIRIDVWPHTWRPLKTMVLCGKWNDNGSSNRSWLFCIERDGSLTLYWSTTGANTLSATCATVMPATTGRLAVRVTLDVDAGAANKTVQFYTAPTLAGSYSTYGAAVTTAGTTSIFNSGATLDVGNGQFDPSFTYRTFGGKCYGLELRSSIGGTVVANPDFTTWSVDDITKVDTAGTPNTWLAEGLACISSDRLRYYGELSSVPHTSDVTGRAVFINAAASGIIERLNAGSIPLRSPLYRTMIQYRATSWGYWPMEDGDGASSIASALTGGYAAQAGAIDFAASAASTLPGTSGAVTFTAANSVILGMTNSTLAVSGILSITVMLRLPSLPVGISDFIYIYCISGTIRRITIAPGPTTFSTTVVDSAGTVLATMNIAYGTANPNGAWVGLNLTFQQNGGNVDMRYRANNVYSDTVETSGPTSFAGTTGRLYNFKAMATNSSAFVGASMAHMLFASTNLELTTDSFRKASNAFIFETAAARMDRLCREELGSPLWIDGYYANSVAMGYQTTDTFMSLLAACADADQGIFYERRDALHMAYRTRQDIETRRDIDLSWTSSHFTETPVDDESTQGLTNTVTVQRSPNGLSATVQVTDGPKGALAPPNGVNPRPITASVNVGYDNLVQNIASWKARIGSWPGPRYPSVKISLHRSPYQLSASLFASAIALNIGDTLAYVGHPSYLAPDDILAAVRGHTETLNKFLWDIAFNCSPAGPLRTGVYDYDDIVGYSRWETNGSTLQTAINSSTTTVILSFSTVGDEWTTTGASYPFDIMLDGERITLNSAPAGSTSPQTFTGVTRSVNGVIKSHLVGVAAVLYSPTYYSL